MKIQFDLDVVHFEEPAYMLKLFKELSNSEPLISFTVVLSTLMAILWT